MKNTAFKSKTEVHLSRFGYALIAATLVACGSDGRDGRDGIDGEDGVDGAPGAAGEQGPPGSSPPSRTLCTPVKSSAVNTGIDTYTIAFAGAPSFLDGYCIAQGRDEPPRLVLVFVSVDSPARREAYAALTTATPLPSASLTGYDITDAPVEERTFTNLTVESFESTWSFETYVLAYTAATWTIF